MHDVIIVGGGPAGLSAALILGRCRRRVLVCDSGRPRNARSQHLNAFLTRDGIDPAEFRRLGRRQLDAYDNVEVRDIAASDVKRVGTGFVVTLLDGPQLPTRKLLLATGVLDRLPAIEGFETFYGRGVFHCPYCDGWEVRDQPIAAYGRGKRGRGLALELTAWSKDLVLCTDGPAELAQGEVERLSRHGIRLMEQPIQRLEGEDGLLARLRFVTGEILPCRALFFVSDEHQASDLPGQLGCAFTRTGDVDTSGYEGTSVPGLFVAGDASRYVQLTIVAAAEGAKAAFAINTELLKEDLK